VTRRRGHASWGGEAEKKSLLKRPKKIKKKNSRDVRDNRGKKETRSCKPTGLEKENQMVLY